MAQTADEVEHHVPEGIILVAGHHVGGPLEVDVLGVRAAREELLSAGCTREASFVVVDFFNPQNRRMSVVAMNATGSGLP